LELWFLGRAVEDRYGRAEFFRIYLLCVVLCGVVWLITHGPFGHSAILCGASGAVCCSTLLYVLNFPRSTLMLFGVIPIQAWMLGAFLIITNLLSQSSSGLTQVGRPSVAFDVHLTGLAFAAAYFYGQWNFSWLPTPSAFSKSMRRKLFGPKLKAFHPEADEPLPDEAQADRILDKIHQHGQDSLTAKERRILEKYSKQVRERRNQQEP
jgi:hypothetical protein